MGLETKIIVSFKSWVFTSKVYGNAMRRSHALCRIEWVIEIQLQLSAQEIDHIHQVVHVSIASGSSFGQLNLVVNAFK